MILSPEFSEQVPAFVFPEYNIITTDSDGPVIETAEWGVIPTWIKDPQEMKLRRMKMVNIQSERILDDKKSVWYRIKKNRCLLPADGTYEHREIKGWKKKVPYYIWLEGDGPFYIPGLYQESEMVDSDGVIHTVRSFGMVTREANQTMSYIHNSGDNKNRMPLYVNNERAKAWIAGSLQEPEMREIMAYIIDDKELRYHPVFSIRGGTPRPDGKHKYDPWEWPGLPPLGNDTPVDPQKSLF